MSRPTVGSSRKMRSGSPARARSEEDALLLAAGELAEEAALDAFKTGGLDEGGVGHGVGVVAAEDGDVLADAEHFRSSTNLQHDAGAEAGGGVAGVCAEDADVAGGVARLRPIRCLTAVDLPAPLGPRRATISPGRRERERLSRARTPLR